MHQGETRPFRSSLCKDGKLVDHYFDDTTTMYESFQRGLRISHDQPCIGSRVILDGEKRGAYVWQTYSEVNEIATNLGSGLHFKGFAQPGSNIGIFSINMPQWTMVDMTCVCYR